MLIPSDVMRPQNSVKDCAAWIHFPHAKADVVDVVLRRMLRDGYDS